MTAEERRQNDPGADAEKKICRRSIRPYLTPENIGDTGGLVESFVETFPFNPLRKFPLINCIAMTSRKESG
jgi:hypothetical protein